MAGLNCGTISASAWPVMRAGCDAAVAVSDEEAIRAVVDLAGWVSPPARAARRPWPESAQPSPTPTGGGLDHQPDAVVVLLSTEGDHR